MQQMALTPNRPFCNKVQQQTSPVCVTSTGPPSLGSQCTQPAMGGSGPICIPTSKHLGQSSGEVAGLPVQENHSDCSGVAQHAMVLGPSDHAQKNPTELYLPAKSAHTTIQSDSTQQSDKPKSTWLLEPQQLRSRASLRQWQHELRLLREDQPDQSIRKSGSFLQSGASLIRWASGHPAFPGQEVIGQYH